jgi:acetyl esterase/lipase
MSISSLIVKTMFAKGDKKRDAGLTTPSDIQRFDNISYGSHKKWHLLDVYLPKSIQGKLPVIMIVHGGGWVYGDKEVYQFYGMSLAQRGFAVVNFSYRLAPKHKHPAQLEDVNSAVYWVLNAEDKYRFDKTNIFLAGDSAGAHLASLFTSICTDSSYAANYSFDVPSGFVPRAVALNCGVYDVNAAIDSTGKLQLNLMRDLLGRKFTPVQLEQINPCKHINQAYPPVYVMTSTGDFLVDQPPYLIQEFKKLGVEHIFKLYGSDENKLPHVFHCDMKNEDAHKCNDEECDFFREHIV